MRLTPTQAAHAEDIIEILRHRGTCLLAGYAGTGKTVTAARVVSTLRAGGLTVDALAPTHRAAGVLGARLGGEARTLHAALGLRPRRLPDGTSDLVGGRTLEADVAVVDEASMIGPGLWRHVQDATRRGIGLLLIGDPAQLPPAEGSGEISPVWSDVQRQYRLTEILRQDDGSQILPLSLRIREALETGGSVTLDELREHTCSDVAIVRGSYEDVGAWVADDVAEGRDSLALGYTNAVVDAANHYGHRRLGRDRIEAGDVVVTGSPYISAGESTPTLYTAQRLRVEAITDEREVTVAGVDCRLAVLGGVDEAVPVPCDPEQHRRATRLLRDRVSVAWRTRDPEHSHLLATLAAWEERIADLRLGYASTVHKAQGSTVGTAYVLWDDLVRAREPGLRLRLAYVAVTRPTTRLAIVSSRA